MNANEFWNENDRRKDQKFYIAFCLLETSLGDYAIARDLHGQKKRNWASTAYYYSFVHAMRLITFIAMGDFPTGHSELIRIYKNGTTRRGQTWTPRFVRNTSNRTQIESASFTRAEIAKHFYREDPKLSELNNLLRKSGEVLDKSRECRNDTNYEGLIIAHEHAHRLVTKSINKLAYTMRNICETILPKIVLLLNKSIEAEARNKYWYAYLNWKNEREGIYYFEDSLKSKIRERKIREDIFKWIEPIRKEGMNVEHAKEVFENIRLGVFKTKQSLMKSFEDKIGELKEFYEKNILMHNYRKINELEYLSGDINSNDS